MSKIAEARKITCAKITTFTVTFKCRAYQIELMFEQGRAQN